MQKLYGPAIVMGLIIGAARSEGRLPTETEITAAVTALSGQANRIEVEVDATTAGEQSD